MTVTRMPQRAISEANGEKAGDVLVKSLQYAHDRIAKLESKFADLELRAQGHLPPLPPGGVRHAVTERSK